jgi:outer membrane protein
MKRFITALLIILMVSLVTGTLSAQDAKVVYIDARKIISDSDAGKGAYKQLSSLKDQKESEAKKRQSKLNSLRESLQTKSATMTPAAKEELESRYTRELKDYERFVQDAKEEMRSMEVRLLNPWSKELDDIIKSYAEKNGVDLVLDKTNPAVIYTSDKSDITKQIMDIFNKRFKEKSGKAKEKKQ